MAENTQVAEQKPQTFTEMMTTTLTEVKDALPSDFSIPRFVQNAVALLNNNKPLAQYAKTYGTNRIKQGLLLGAYLGLDSLNSEFHLIPYGAELNFQKDYRGARKLIMKYSIRPVKDVYAMLVRDGDLLEEVVEMGVRSVNFKPLPLNRGKTIGAFAVVLYEDGGVAYDVMNIDELEATRKKSKAANAMAWKDFPGEMQKKTVLHRLSKQIPLDFANQQQKDAFMADVAIDTEKVDYSEEISDPFAQAEVVEGEVIDAEATEIEEDVTETDGE
jgi:recombination protein RecT